MTRSCRSMCAPIAASKQLNLGLQALSPLINLGQLFKILDLTRKSCPAQIKPSCTLFRFNWGDYFSQNLRLDRYQPIHPKSWGYRRLFNRKFIKKSDCFKFKSCKNRRFVTFKTHVLILGYAFSCTTLRVVGITGIRRDSIGKIMTA